MSDEWAFRCAAESEMSTLEDSLRRDLKRVRRSAEGFRELRDEAEFRAVEAERKWAEAVHDAEAVDEKLEAAERALEELQAAVGEFLRDAEYVVSASVEEELLRALSKETAA